MKKKCIYVMIILFISFFININNTYAAQEITCRYLYPYENAKYTEVIYSTTSGGSEYNLKVVKDGKASNFKDNGFNKEVIADNKCPKYVDFSSYVINKTLKKSSESKFIDQLKSKPLDTVTIMPLYSSKVDSATKNSYEETYKIYLKNTINNINSTFDRVEKSLKQACGSDYKKYIDKDNYNVENFTSYISSRYGNVSKEAMDKNMSEDCWGARVTYANYSKQANNYVSVFEQNSDLRDIAKRFGGTKYDEIYEFAKLPRKGSKSISKLYENEELEESLVEDINSLNANRCEVLCMNENSTSTSACKSSSESYSKCITAFNSCENIQDTTAKTACLENIMGKEEYAQLTEKYNKTMSDLQDSLEQVKYKLNKGKVGTISVKFKPYKLKCSDVSILHDLWILALIIAPVLTILFGVLDFSKAVIAGDEVKIKECWKKFPRRLLAVILLFLIPTLINIFLSSFSTDESSSDVSLLKCIISGE